MANVSVSVPPKLMALMVGKNVPVEEGVPEMRPVESLMLKLAGKPVALKLVGLCRARIW